MTGWYCHQAWVISLDRFLKKKSSYILTDRLVPCSYTFTRRSGLGQGGRVVVRGDYLCTWSELPPTTPEWYFFLDTIFGGCSRQYLYTSSELPQTTPTLSIAYHTPGFTLYLWRFESREWNWYICYHEAFGLVNAWIHQYNSKYFSIFDCLSLFK